MSESGPRTRVLSLVRFYEDWLTNSRPIEFSQRVQLRRELSERAVSTTQSHEAPLRAVSSYPLLLPSGHRAGGVQKRRKRPSQPFIPTRKSDAEAQTVIEVKQAVKEKRDKTRRKRETKKRRVSAHPKLEKLDHITPEQVETPIQLNIYPAQEILSSERSYVNSLLMMSHAYLKPIEDGRQTLSVDSYRIFANIRSIIELNKIFLTLLEGRRINEWNKMPKSEQLLGDLFVDQADLFKIYIEYCVNYHEAYALVQELKHHSEFNRFATKNNQYGSVLDLNDLLIMPVQRVPRYKMLLENLLKFTLESHPDYENLKAAIEKMGSLADLINAKLKEQKSQRRMAYIASRLPEESHEAADLIAPTRRLIAEFTFTSFKVKIHSGGETQTLAKPQQVYFFLFNDKILLAKGYSLPALTTTSSDSFTLPSLSSPDLGLNMIIKDTHLPAKMEPIAFMDLQSSFLRKILNAPNTLTFQLVNPKGYYVLQAQSEADKNQLKESFREALVGLNNDARIKRSLIRVFTDEKSHFGICEAIEHAPAFSERILSQDLALESNKETIRALEDLLETNRVVLQSRPVTPSPMKKRREKKVIDKLKSAITVFSPKKVKARAAAKHEDKENTENMYTNVTQAEALVRQIDDLKKRQQELRTDGAKTPPYATPPATPRTPMATPRIDMCSTPFATPRVQEAPRTPFLERELLFETPKSERLSRRKSILGSIKKSGIKIKKSERHNNEATPRKNVVPALDFKRMEIVN